MKFRQFGNPTKTQDPLPSWGTKLIMLIDLGLQVKLPKTVAGGKTLTNFYIEWRLETSQKH